LPAEERPSFSTPAADANRFRGLPAQLDLFDEKLLPGTPVFGGLVGMTNGVVCCEVGGRDQFGSPVVIRRMYSEAQVSAKK
jgi:hypothetical protein